MKKNLKKNLVVKAKYEIAYNPIKGMNKLLRGLDLGFNEGEGVCTLFRCVVSWKKGEDPSLERLVNLEEKIKEAFEKVSDCEVIMVKFIGKETVYDRVPVQKTSRAR